MSEDQMEQRKSSKMMLKAAFSVPRPWNNDHEHFAMHLNYGGAGQGKWPYNAFKVKQGKIHAHIPLGTLPDLMEYMEFAHMPAEEMIIETYDDVIWRGWNEMYLRCKKLNRDLIFAKLRTHHEHCCLKNNHEDSPCLRCWTRRRSI